jgi:hypothetical protein
MEISTLESADQPATIYISKASMRRLHVEVTGVTNERRRTLQPVVGLLSAVKPWPGGGAINLLIERPEVIARVVSGEIRLGDPLALERIAGFRWLPLPTRRGGTVFLLEYQALFRRRVCQCWMSSRAAD